MNRYRGRRSYRGKQVFFIGLCFRLMLFPLFLPFFLVFTFLLSFLNIFDTYKDMLKLYKDYFTGALFGFEY